MQRSAASVLCPNSRLTVEAGQPSLRALSSSLHPCWWRGLAIVMRCPGWRCRYVVIRSIEAPGSTRALHFEPEDASSLFVHSRLAGLFAFSRSHLTKFMTSLRWA